MEEQHPISDIMGKTMQKLREMVDANTIIGTPVTTPDGIMIIPVSKLMFGFGCGGSEYQSKIIQPKDQPVMFGGGSGAGVNVTPVAFLIVEKGNVRLLPIANPAENTVDRVIDAVPTIFDRIADFFGKKKKAQEANGNAPADEQ